METPPETAASTSGSLEITLSPLKKRPKKPMSATEKLLVLNLYTQTVKDWPPGESRSLAAYANKTAGLLGISERTVRRIVRENKTNSGNLSPPKKTGPKKSFKEKFDEYTFAAIRRIVYQFYRTNELPTLARINGAIGADPNLPKFSKNTLRKVLEHLNFKYINRKDKNEKLTSQNYLKEVKQHRKNGKPIYYQNSTGLTKATQ